jgi:hypothetical protein
MLSYLYVNEVQVTEVNDGTEMVGHGRLNKEVDLV